MLAIPTQVWLFAILGVIVVVALLLGRRFMFTGGGVSVRTGPDDKAGRIAVAEDVNLGGTAGNVTGVRGTMPGAAQDVGVLNRAVIKGDVGDITGIDTAAPRDPKA